MRHREIDSDVSSKNIDNKEHTEDPKENESDIFALGNLISDVTKFVGNTGKKQYNYRY